MADKPQPQTRIKSVLEDPSAQAIARVYAGAFLAAAADAGVEAALEEFASFLEDVLAAHPDFESLLLSGIVSRDEKVAVIDRTIAPSGSEFFVNFLRVLARHDRLDILPLVFSESQLRHEVLTGRKRVRVTSPQPLSEDLLATIRQQLNDALPFEPIVEPATDASLLGGLIIQIEDTVYDSSLRTRLKQLRGRMRERSLHEIQSGRDRFSSPEGD
jgi:F-type H+-transporting ATPase subunit delta